MAIISEAGEVEIFKKLFNFAKGVVSSSKDDYKKNKNDIHDNNMEGLTKSSIMRTSRDLVMSFPVLCTDTIKFSTASMISKAIERNCVTTLQMLFASANLSGNNGIDVIKKWHSNFDNDMTLDEYIDAVDAISRTAFNPSKDSLKSRETFKAELNNLKKAMVKECAENNVFYPESSFSESSISDYVLESKAENIRVIREYDNNFYMDDNMVEDSDGQEYTKQQFDANMQNKRFEFEKEKFYRQQANSNAQTQAAATRTLIDDTRAKAQAKYQYDTFNMQKRRNAFNDKIALAKLDDQLSRSRTELFQKQLLDSDVKKANELVPTMMIVQYLATSPDGKTSVDRQFIAGVKTRLVSCNSFEIIDRIKSIEKNKVNRLNLVRATTKEISFCKDFIAGIEQAKIDAKRNSNLSRNSAIWRSLQDRATKSGLNRLKKNRANDAGAITTLVISEEEVNFLKKSENIDLNVPATCRSIMEAYNLMGLVIVDEQIEIARFFFDGSTGYQEYSFNTLERESNDNSYKKVVNLLSKNNIM